MLQEPGPLPSRDLRSERLHRHDANLPAHLRTFRPPAVATRVLPEGQAQLPAAEVAEGACRHHHEGEIGVFCRFLDMAGVQRNDR